MRGKLTIYISVLTLVIILSYAQMVSAARYSSTSYVIDASVLGNSMGGVGSTTNYSLTSTGGESIVGEGSGGSYKVGMGYVAQLPKSIQITMQPSGVIAYFPLDEPSGTASADRSVNAYDAYAQTAPDWQPGKIGGSLGPVPVGSTQYLQTKEGSGFNTSYLTACGWAFKTAVATNPTIVSRGDNTLSVNGMWSLGYGNFQKPRFSIVLSGVTQQIVATNQASLNAWHHVCGTYDGSYMRIYVDGLEDGNLAVAPGGALSGISTPVSIGARGSGTQTSNLQSLDEIKIYNRALTADEIKAEYDAQNSGYTSGLSLGTVIPGISNQVLSDVIISTDASEYSLAASQDHNLTNGIDSIPPVSGSIASPSAWSEGSTKGLGFSLSATNATSLPGIWGSGANFAAFPGTPTTFYTRTGVQSVVDYVTMKLRLDVAVTQPASNTPYTNTIIITGTMSP